MRFVLRILELDRRRIGGVAIVGGFTMGIVRTLSPQRLLELAQETRGGLAGLYGLIWAPPTKRRNRRAV